MKKAMTSIKAIFGSLPIAVASVRASSSLYAASKSSFRLAAPRSGSSSVCRNVRRISRRSSRNEPASTAGADSSHAITAAPATSSTLLG